MMLGAFFTGAKVFESQIWDPLGNYPIQEVIAPRDDIVPSPGGENFEEGVSLPVLYWDEEIEVHATKCVKPEEGIIQIEGDFAWTSDEPPGRNIEAGGGVGPRGPGCVNYNYRNPLPDEVMAELLKLKEQGLEYSDWHIGGVETPIDKESGREGAPRSWITITFRIMHEDAPAVEGE